MPSLYDECEHNGGKIIAKPEFAHCSCPPKEENKISEGKDMKVWQVWVRDLGKYQIKC